ncbi:MAG: peptide ABC transporter substrate-binding protein, partial [Planctomycetes bacterium]|nr:peptide ABC transporter substrate-binding protein [Planctomycetota bacterium]
VQEVDVVSLLGMGFFGFDWDLKPFALSETVVSWQTSKDRMSDKVVIRDDLTWSDGHPLTAHDVVFSFQTIMNPRVPVPAMRSQTDKLRWVEAYDDHTLVFFQREPLATNDWNLNFGIIPKHIYENSLKEDVTLQRSAYHVKYENDPVTGGPYIITRRSRGQEILVTARESWYMHSGKQVRPRPYFQQVRFRIIEDPNTALLAIKSGQTDELELQAAQWQDQTSGPDFYRFNTKADGVEWLYFYFGWNNKSPFFSDVRVRQAMSYAFDHDEMLNTLCYGLYEPCTGIWHPQSWMAPKKPTPRYRQDLDKAEDLLDQAGWEDHDGDGTRDKMIGGRLVPFEFSMIVRQDPERVRICELLKTNLDQIGIVCNVTPMEATVLQQRMLDHDFQGAYGGWSTGADPDTAENIWGTGQERNFVQYSNPEVDRLFDLGRKEFDREKRGEIYGRMHELIYADQPYTFLFFRKSFYGFNKQLRGINFSPRGPYHYNPGMGGIWKALN